MDIQVHEARTPEEKQAIFRLRYQVYVEEMKCRPQLADHEHRLLGEPIDDYAHNFYATTGGDVVGALRGIARRDGPLEFEPLYDLERFRPFYPDAVSMTTKLVVAPGRRASLVLKLLVMRVYQVGRQLGIQFDFLDCWPHLINLYEHLGYRRYKTNVNHPEAGYMTPMVLILEDIHHLEQVGSPLTEMARGLANSSAAAEFFAKTFPDYARVGIQRLLSPEDLWALLSSKLAGDLQEEVPLFHAMSREEVQILISLGNLVNCRSGDRIITMGEARQEFYTLLSGKAEVRIEVDGRMVALRTFAKGDTFGETAYLAATSRTADVFALENCDVLVHDACRLASLEQRQPSLAVKVYRNLARILSFRLIRSRQLGREAG